ncbi:hypothetical protein EZV62_023706 [Acer yangbiense]|uniref:DUF4283 domain-containing protein n=1 Tax=Acer yangbiense TaxID=1000413 RepID=A0A5C7H3Z6_9ROSI|nr:hypothetical protein EZV62_023706 [Acer yangbiense]
MKSEELEMLCSAHSIEEKERPVGTLNSNLKEKEECLLSLCLVGKVLNNKLVNKDAFINFLSTIWRTMKMKYIQSGGPWTFDKAIIAFEEPLSTGKMIEEVIDVDLLAAKNIDGSFVRVRVAVSMDEPLMRSLRVDLKLDHSIRDCSEPGDGKEVTTEAQLRLNVWLRSESPSKRFNLWNGPSRRRNWGNQGGKPHISIGQGNWRSKTTWKRSDDGGSERQAGNQSWWKNGKLKSQVGDNSADDKFTAAKEKKSQPSKGISINEGKERDKLPAKETNLMEVDPSVGQANVLGPTYEFPLPK